MFINKLYKLLFRKSEPVVLSRYLLFLGNFICFLLLYIFLYNVLFVYYFFRCTLSGRMEIEHWPEMDRKSLVSFHTFFKKIVSIDT